VVSVTDFVTIPCEVIITNVVSTERFAIMKTCIPRRLVLAIYGNLKVSLDLYPIDLINQRHSTAAFSQTQTRKGSAPK